MPIGFHNRDRPAASLVLRLAIFGTIKFQYNMTVFDFCQSKQPGSKGIPKC